MDGGKNFPGTVQLPSKFPGIGQAKGRNPVSRYDDGTGGEPRESLVVEWIGCGCGQDASRQGATDGKCGPCIGQIGDRDRLAVPADPVQVVDQALLEKSRRNDIEPVAGEAHHRCFEFDASTPVQKVREDDPSIMRWKPVRDDAIEKGSGVPAPDLELAKGRDVHDSRGVPDGAAFISDQIVAHVPAKRVVIALGNSGVREPPRPFMTVDFLENRPPGLEAVKERVRHYRTSREPVEVGKRYFVTKAVVLLRLDHLPVPAVCLVSRRPFVRAE